MRIKIFILFIFISFEALSQNSIFWLNKPYRNQNNVQWVGTSTNGHLSYSFNERTFTDNYNGSYSYGNVDWSGERWIAIRGGDLIYSFDGITWVSYGFSGVSYIFWDVYKNEWVGQRATGGTNYTIKSKDGINWNNYITNATLGKIISTGLRYVGLNSQGGSIYYSSDAITWRTKDMTLDYNGAQIWDIAWTGSSVVAAGTYLNEDIRKSTVWSSSDGSTYSIYYRDDNQVHDYFTKIIYFNGYIIVSEFYTVFNLSYGNVYSFPDKDIKTLAYNKDKLLISVNRYGTDINLLTSLNGRSISYLDYMTYSFDNMKHRSIIKYPMMMLVCPSVSTSIYELGVNQVRIKNTLNSDGGSDIIRRGICWSLNENPTVNDAIMETYGTAKDELIYAYPLSGGTVYHFRSFAQNGQCISYSDDVPLQTYAASPATVVTTEPTSIGAVSAISGGNVTFDGGGFIQQRGVCWGTSSNPVYTGSHSEDGTGTGVFISNISGLSPNTLYYVRAYAVNPAGVVYGNQYSFTTTSTPTAPLVTTLDPTDITNQSAHLYGRVDSDGGASVSEYGFTYGTSPNPDLSGGSVAIGSGIGSFDVILSGIPSATTFHYRAYAINSAGTSYGVDKSFTTLAGGLATLETYGAYNIDETSAYISGTIVDTGSATITTTGFIIGLATNPDPTLSSNLFFTQHDGVVAYDQFTGLTSGTTYKARIYAINEAGTAYGNVISFQTTSMGALPNVTTNSISNVTSNSASSGGNVTFDGGSTITARGVCWNTTGNPTIADNKTSDGSGDGSFTSSITGLTCGTTYYVRAYATNSNGTAYGNSVTFSTELCTYIPTVSLNTINKYGDTYATFSGAVTNDGNSTVTERGFVYSIAPNPTTSSNKIISGSGVGVFSANAYGLSSSTKYYVRAYAINNVGTAYSNELDFTTLESPTNVSISTSVPVNITTSSATLGGNISSDGGNTVTERGVVYGLSINPTTSNTKIQSGNGIGIYSVNVTGLTQGTTYHVRAYAINSNGTFYGADESFITSIDGATVCNAGQTFPGGQSYPSTNTIVLGSGIGDVTLTFSAYDLPDFFLVEYNSTIYNSGWRGSSSYDYGGNSRSAFKSALWGKIDPANPSFPTTFPNIILYPEDGYPRVNSTVATGSISFTKSTSNPTTAIVKVYAPISGTRWSYVLSCPN